MSRTHTHSVVLTPPTLKRSRSPLAPKASARVSVMLSDTDKFIRVLLLYPSRSEAAQWWPRDGAAFVAIDGDGGDEDICSSGRVAEWAMLDFQASVECAPLLGALGGRWGDGGGREEINHLSAR